MAEGQSGSTALTFTVSLSKAAAFPVQVNYTLSGGTATRDEDFDAASAKGSLTFPAGETSRQLTVTVNGDEDFEPNETVQLTFTPHSFAEAFVSVVGGPATGTIRNDDRKISIHVTDSWSGFENNPDVDAQFHSIRFKVVLDLPASAPVTVDYETFDDTASGSAATAGEDYEAKSGTLTFEADETEQTVDITLIDDDIVEHDESVGLRLSNANSDSEEFGIAIPDAEASRSIWSNDQYALSIDSPSVIEGRSGTTDLTFTVSLSKEASFPVPVSYTVSGGTATRGEDYDAASADGSLTFQPGETRKQLTVTVNGDTVHEPNETVEVTVSLHPGVVGKYVEAGGDTATGTGTILGDDHRISFGEGSDGYEDHADDGNRPVSFKVVLDPPSTVPVTVHYVPEEGTATSPEDFVSAAARLKFNPGETETLLEFAVVNDDIVEKVEALELVLSNPMVEGSDVAGSVAAASTVTLATARRTRNIHSDDRYELTVDSPSVDEGGPGSTTDLEFTVGLSKEASFDVQVDTTVGGTATAGDDYTGLAAGRLTFSAGETAKTLTATVTGDRDVEPDETVEISASLVSGFEASAEPGGSSAMGTGTILNDDYGFSIDSPTVTEGNSGTTDLTFTVTLDPPVPDEVRVDYATSDREGQKAAEAGGLPSRGGDDYEPARGTLVFPADTTTRTITITVNGDGTFEFDDRMDVVLSNPVGPKGSSFTIPRAGVGTIKNDDVLTYTIRDNSVSVLEGRRRAEGTPRDTQEFLYFRVDLSQDVYLGAVITCLAEEGTAGGGDNDDRNRSDNDYYVDET